MNFGEIFMWLDEGKVTIAAAAFAIAGIILLLLLSETPQTLSVAQASVAQGNSLVMVGGTAQNVTKEKFSLCREVCISVRAGAVPSLALLSGGREVLVSGRVKEYLGRRYIEAEKLEIR